jgi:crotonobetainyl-CoA:carnitine CoA-transferase CaiB-like acyl-CoA transferase
MSNKKTVVGRFEFDPTEFEARKANAKAFYVVAFEEAHRPGRGAVVKLMLLDTAFAAEEYHRYRCEGFQLMPEQSPIPSFEVKYGSTVIHLMKPLSVQDADLAIIYAEVEQAYVAELAAQRSAEVDRQVEFQLQAERRKELAAQQAKEVADRQRIRDEVSASLAGGK